MTGADKHPFCPFLQLLPAGSGLLGIHIDAGHQVRRQLIKRHLVLRKSLDIHPIIAAEHQPVFRIHIDRLSPDMAAVPLVDLKMQVGKVQRADMGQGFPVQLPPDNLHPVQLRRRIARDNLTEAAIRRVEGVLLPVIGFPLPLQHEIPIAVLTEQHPVRNGQQARMVDIAMGQRHGLFPGGKAGNHTLQNGLQFRQKAPESAVDAQQLLAVVQQIRIAAAGRLHNISHDLGTHAPLADNGLVIAAAVTGDKPGKPADIVKGFEGRLVLAVQHLHNPVGFNDKLVGLPPVQSQNVPHFVGKLNIKHRTVQNLLGNTVFQNLHITDGRHFIQQLFHNGGFLNIQAHTNLLVRRAALLGVEIRDIDMVPLQQLQYRRQGAGHIQQPHLHQHDPLGNLILIGQIADVPQVLGDFL